MPNFVMADLKSWLSEQGLERLYDVLQENEVDAEVLPDLTDADLRGADITDANFSSVKLDGANLEGVNLEDARRCEGATAR